MSMPYEAEQTYQQAIAARELAAGALYRTELAVHDAHQTHVDEWIRAAHDRLHDAVVRYEDAAAVVSSLQHQPCAA